LKAWQIIKPPTTIVIVVDAIDECAKDVDGSEIVQLLGEIASKLPFPLKFLVTSRPEPHLRAAFQSDAVQPRCRTKRLLPIYKGDIDADIDVFLRHHLALVSTSFFGGSPWPTEENIHSLAVKAAGLFVFASTAVQFITDPLADDPQGQLDAVLHAETAAASGSEEFRGLDYLYTAILSKALPENSTWKLAERYHLVMGTIINLLEPLSIRAVQLLLRLPKETVRLALRRLQSIIVVPESDQDVARVLHPSFVEFVTEPDRCRVRRCLIDSESIHGILALRCLERMVQSLCRQICNPKKFPANLPPAEMLQLALPPDLRYACLHWATTLSRSSPADPSCFAVLSSFFFEHVLHWLEVLSLLRHLYSAAPGLELAKSWLLVSTWRFVLLVPRCVDVSVLQVNF
jgi:hypothetical protein